MNHAEYQKQWYHSHPGYYTKYRNERYLKNRMAILKQQKGYNQSEKGKVVHKKAYLKYAHSKKGQKKIKEWTSKHKSESNAKYYQKNKEKCNIKCSAYKKTDKGKMTVSKMMAKRKRNLGFISLFDNPFDKSELIDWHHVNNDDVVALPRDLHRHFQGKFHRENLIYIIKQIYMMEMM